MKSAESRVTAEFTGEAILLTFNDERISEEHQVKELEASILPVLDQAKEKAVVLNLAAVRFISTIFLALLIRIHKRICELGGRRAGWPYGIVQFAFQHAQNPRGHKPHEDIHHIPVRINSISPPEACSPLVAQRRPLHLGTQGPAGANPPVREQFAVITSLMTMHCLIPLHLTHRQVL